MARFAFLLPLLALLVLRAVWDFNGLYGQDAHEYLRYARALMHWMQGGPSPGDYFWSPNYPLLGALLGFVCGGDATWGLQLASALTMGGTVWFGWRMIRLLWPAADRTAGVWTMLALALSPEMLKFGVLGMSDMMATLGVAGAWYHALRFDKTQRERALAHNHPLPQTRPVFGFLHPDLTLAAFWAAWAFGCRYACAPLLLPAGALVLLRLRRAQLVYLPPALGAAILPMLPYFGVKWATAPTAFLQHEWLSNWSLAHLFRRDFALPDGAVHYPLPNIFYAAYGFLRPEYLPTALLLLPFFRGKDYLGPRLWPMALAVGAYSLFLAGIPFQNLRFHLPAFPLIVVLAFPAWWRVQQFFAQKTGNKGYSLLCGIAVLTSLFFYIKEMKPLVKMAATEKRLSHALLETQASTAYLFYVDGAARTYGYKGTVHNLWSSGQGPFEPGAAVLFNERQFAPQFSERPLWAHWRALQAQGLDTVRVWDDGWGLFRVR